MSNRLITELTGHTNPTDLLTKADGQALFGPHVITPQQFGAVADNATDDSAAFAAAISAAHALRILGVGYADGGPRIFVPAGKYYLGTTTLDITDSIIFEGEGTIAGSGSVLRWADNTTGIRTQYWDTTGATGPATAGLPYRGAQNAVIRNLTLIGGFSSTESESYGVHLRAKAYLENLSVTNFGGDGVHMIVSATSGTYEGNANDSYISNVFASSCRKGLHIEGLDVNATTILNFQANSNRQWGIYSSNIGVNIIGGDFSSNGQIAGFPTMVSYSGNWYACLAGQETWCSTHAPSGTSADNQGWYYIGAGGAVSTRPAWASGTTYRAGGSICIQGNSNYSLVSGVYTENDQGPPQIDNCFTLWLSPLGGNGRQAPILNAIGGGGFDGRPYGGQMSGNSGEVYTPRVFHAGDSAHGDTTLGSPGTTVDEIWRHKPSGGTRPHVYMDYGGNNPAIRDTNGHILVYWDVTNGQATFVQQVNTAAIAPTSLALNGGTPLTKAVVYAPSITPASVAAATVAEQTFTVTGLTTADKVIVNPPGIGNATGIAGARVSAADTLAIRFVNPTAGALTPSSGAYTVLAFRS